MSERTRGLTGAEFVLGGMFLVFLALKLTGTISWSWWWVTAPLWLPFVGGLAIFAVFFPLLLWLRRRD